MPTTRDYSKYRYEKYEGRPNVWIGYHITDPATRYKIAPLVLDVARRMFARAQRNVYIFTGPSSQNEVATMYRCTVEREDEVLGFFASSMGRSGKQAVLVDNERIRKERERGGAMVTSDTKRAASLALKKFLPTSNEEVLLKSYSTMNERTRNMVNAAANRKRDVIGTNINKFLSYVEKNWDTEGQALLEKIGVSPSDIVPISESVAETRKLASLRARAERGLTFVLQKGDTVYAVPFKLTSYSPADLHQRAFHVDDMPDDMKIKVGGLRAALPDEYVQDWGMKLGTDSFMIFFDLADVPEDDEGDEA